MRIAIVGAGIAGLGCAHALREHAVTLFEAAPRLGGHTNTVDVTLDGRQSGVDTGFLVFNERTYPNLIRLFDELGVPTAASDMSFGLSVARPGRAPLEWAGSSLDTVFAQRRNLASPAFLRMLADLLRFNAQATRIATGREDTGALTLGEFLDANRYGASLRRWYLLPMAAAIWSCPTATMLDYPVATFVRFCHNHGLLQVNDRPQWFTVQGGARQYVEAIARGLSDVRVATPVLAVTPAVGGKVVVTTTRGAELFDQVVLACHSDQSARLLAEGDERRHALAACRYQPNRALLHTDARLMPQSRRVWSAWNYLGAGADDDDPGNVSVTYWLNKLQPLPFRTPLFVSLNPLVEPEARHVLAAFDYEHPVFDRAALDARSHLEGLQGRDGLWFAGAWTGYGFHEDGLVSGLAVATRLRALRDATTLQAA